jgi:hypothetical protein
MITKREIAKLTTAERTRLLQILVDSFDQVVVTGLYGVEETIDSGSIKGGVVSASGIDRVRSNNIVIVTNICTG